MSTAEFVNDRRYPGVIDPEGNVVLVICCVLSEFHLILCWHIAVSEAEDCSVSVWLTEL